MNWRPFLAVRILQNTLGLVAAPSILWGNSVAFWYDFRCRLLLDAKTLPVTNTDKGFRSTRALRYARVPSRAVTNLCQRLSAAHGWRFGWRFRRPHGLPAGWAATPMPKRGATAMPPHASRFVPPPSGIPQSDFREPVVPPITSGLPPSQDRASQWLKTGRSSPLPRPWQQPLEEIPKSDMPTNKSTRHSRSCVGRKFSGFRPFRPASTIKTTTGRCRTTTARSR